MVAGVESRARKGDGGVGLEYRAEQWSVFEAQNT